MNLKGAVDAQLAKLRAAGLQAAFDPQDLNLPGVLLRPPTLATRFGKGSYSADWEVWLLAPDTGMYNVLDQFGPLIDTIQDALGWPVQTIRPDTALIGQGTSVPCLVLSFTATLKPEEAPNG